MGLCKNYEATFKGRGSIRNKGDNKETLSYSEVAQALEQDAQGGCGVPEVIQSCLDMVLGKQL